MSHLLPSTMPASPYATELFCRISQLGRRWRGIRLGTFDDLHTVQIATNCGISVRSLELDVQDAIILRRDPANGRHLVRVMRSRVAGALHIETDRSDHPRITRVTANIIGRVITSAVFMRSEEGQQVSLGRVQPLDSET